MPEGWQILEPPSFAAAGGGVAGYRRWLRDECRARAGSWPLVLAGHSFGAALAVLAAADDEVAVARLVLVNPAGLPLSKPVALMLVDFSRRLLAGWFPAGAAVRCIAAVVAHPRLASRLGREVRGLDLHAQLSELRRRGIPCTVIGVSTDTLTPPEHCRRIAALTGGDYHELAADGGHLWFLRTPLLLQAELARSSPEERPADRAPDTGPV